MRHEAISLRNSRILVEQLPLNRMAPLRLFHVQADMPEPVFELTQSELSELAPSASQVPTPWRLIRPQINIGLHFSVHLGGDGFNWSAF